VPRVEAPPHQPIKSLAARPAEGGGATNCPTPPVPLAWPTALRHRSSNNSDAGILPKQAAADLRASSRGAKYLSCWESLSSLGVRRAHDPECDLSMNLPPAQPMEAVSWRLGLTRGDAPLINPRETIDSGAPQLPARAGGKTKPENGDKRIRPRGGFVAQHPVPLGRKSTVICPGDSENAAGSTCSRAMEERVPPGKTVVLNGKSLKPLRHQGRSGPPYTGGAALVGVPIDEERDYTPETNLPSACPTNCLQGAVYLMTNNYKSHHGDYGSAAWRGRKEVWPKKILFRRHEVLLFF